MVVSGHARFTVLTDHVLRMEWSKTSAFEDRATLAVINRNTPVPSFKTHTTGGMLTITTQALKLTYKVGSPFTADTLRVTASAATIATSEPQSKFSGWAPGQANDANLLGTIKSLDQLSVLTKKKCT